MVCAHNNSLSLTPLCCCHADAARRERAPCVRCPTAGSGADPRSASRGHRVHPSSFPRLIPLSCLALPSSCAASLLHIATTTFCTLVQPSSSPPLHLPCTFSAAIIKACIASSGCCTRRQGGWRRRHDRQWRGSGARRTAGGGREAGAVGPMGRGSAAVQAGGEGAQRGGRAVGGPGPQPGARGQARGRRAGAGEGARAEPQVRARLPAPRPHRRRARPRRGGATLARARRVLRSGPRRGARRTGRRCCTPRAIGRRRYVSRLPRLTHPGRVL